MMDGGHIILLDSSGNPSFPSVQQTLQKCLLVHTVALFMHLLAIEQTYLYHYFVEVSVNTSISYTEISDLVKFQTA